MNRLPKVTIGIPAYNEEANIGQVLHEVLTRKTDCYRLSQVIVIADGCTDNTVSEIHKYKDKRLKVIVNPKRVGQSACQNTIFKSSTSDIVVLLEADTLSSDRKFVKKLIAPLIKNPHLGIVQGNACPLPPQTLIEKILYRQWIVYWRYTIKRSEWTFTGRGGRAFTKAVYLKLRWPTGVQEDSFAKLWCMQRKIPYVFKKTAVRHFRLPQTVLDQLYVSYKNKAGASSLELYFEKQDIFSIYQRTLSVRICMFASLFINHSVDCILYMFIKTYNTIHVRIARFSDFWPTTITTKRLVNAV